ncbi:MAG: ribonuclease [Ewingella americana]|uniref:Ribonuclease n=2 Tax=Ewingella americana TaxID=41202 RepID=A0A085GPD4_EWIA3|nr:ribonuclease domain-containing protein [Ewingella americana]KAA8728238.1 ribonuclease [Ewingella americana]KFC85579.1 putative ribonuclease [Ewingella americana ATCC 33852]MCI1677980.1 ribonuclease [Ewingella americana]MCI2141172.1 ribonuclease [Ewingella americana]MCI2164076.1 ribonuclease [Ewingella americana]
MMNRLKGLRQRSVWISLCLGLLAGQFSSVVLAKQSSDTLAGLTSEQTVVSYLRQNHRLPDYYVTKRQARDAGWDARAGNLCQVLPGKAIGGDRFSNREGRLPNAYKRVWREADINYRCGRRGADRVLFASDGLIYVSRDHYKQFVRVE